jgi:GH35 family endo-1,4-beta-xylanase
VRSPIAQAYPEGGLAALAAPYGLRVGMAVRPIYLEVPVYRDIVLREFSTLTPENHLKMEFVLADPAKPNYSQGNLILDFAAANKMAARGHTLVWHYYPPFLKGEAPAPAKTEAILRDFVKQSMLNAKGKVAAWDVVNEPVDDLGKWRETLWYKAMGKQYVEKALRWARAADPTVPLFINDYNIEGVNDKSDALYAIVKDLVDRGVPLDGIGMQCHFDLDTMPELGSMYANMQRFAELGLRIHLTEFDIRMSTPATPAKLARQAKAYADIFRLALTVPAVESITFWNLSDIHSWVPSVHTGYGAAHLWDENFQPKPAYFAIADALKAGPPGDAWIKQLASRTSVERIVRPFVAVHADAAPAIDGVVSPGEWDAAWRYPFVFNQLSAKDKRPTPAEDLAGSWRTMVRGSTVYGLVERADDATMLELGNLYMNDCVEVFLLYNGAYFQLRSLVGKPWALGSFPGQGEGAWSADGKVFEFALTVPDYPVEGVNVGWLIALADSDKKPVQEREEQIYPLPGSNTAYQGRGIGELIGLRADGSNSAGGIVGTPLIYGIASASAAPVVDNAVGTPEWADSVYMPMGFVHGGAGAGGKAADGGLGVNQDARSLGLVVDQTGGWWKLAHFQGKLYGAVQAPGVGAVGWKVDGLRVAVKTGDDVVEKTFALPASGPLEFELALPQAAVDAGKLRLDLAVDLTGPDGKSYRLRSWPDDGSADARWALAALW